ncbi:MAG: hypothetical protein HYV62_17465 [Candidatus Rokubacteria bacterium]|nr:hypothetical protein [Candidatus Rokubacteria bacterium]
MELAGVRERFVGMRADRDAERADRLLAELAAGAAVSTARPPLWSADPRRPGR